MIPLNTLPQDPGVYQFKDKDNKIIYIGKAKNLRKRVSQYFQNPERHAIKTQVLVRQIENIEVIIVDNEVEALLLENRLIKKHSPKYNINLKDSKTYAYITLTQEPYPRLTTTRNNNAKGKLFGPYTDGSARREVFDLAQKLFKLRVCRTMPKRACLNYHLNLCTAPCILNVNKEQYQEQVNDATKFLKGDISQSVEKLEQEMKEASQEKKYEVALEKRRQKDALLHLTQKQKVDLIKNIDQDFIVYTTQENRSSIEIFSVVRGVISGKKNFRFETQEDLFEEFITLYYSQNPPPHELVVNTVFWQNEPERETIELYLSKIKGSTVKITYPQRGEKKELLMLAEKNAQYGLENATLKEIQEKLCLPHLPLVIECFDISNLGREHVVAGMTQWVNGKPNKSEYRRFEIQTVQGRQDDFAAMYEVIQRRYKRLRDESKPFPDLIIIDGGKGQLGMACKALEELGLQIPLFGLAKREEEIYLPREENPHLFNTNSPMMLFIRSVRDSVHNYVLSYNKKKRQMKFKKQTKEVD
ncbi:excinuclease ABC subunit UvrC [Candidatus Woesearchaeota archaeon]|nr:excinuclease ABC subunit UvrC [Candidatus Woesearchaeota archaeon]